MRCRTFFGEVLTTQRIVPGDFEDVSLVLVNATVGDVWVVADDGSGPPSMRAGGYQFSTIDVPVAIATVPLGINSKGQVVGEAEFAAPLGWRAFLLSNGQFSSFGVPAVTRTWASGINDQGQIVEGVNFGDYGFLTTVENFGTTIRLDVPG